MNPKLKNFYKLKTSDRIAVLNELNLFDDNLNIKTPNLVFEHLIENYITTYEMGMGVAPNFLIDDKVYHIPMVTEEPSVIAGASHAAKIISENGGFKTISLKREMIGQIIFKNVKDQQGLKMYLEKNANKFESIAIKAHPEIHKLGGGFVSLNVAIKPENFVCLYVVVNTLDAMGANTINTILEAIANYIENDYGAEVLMSILSNLAVNSLVTTKVTIDPKTLKHSDVIAKDIANASLYASIDPFRAATHNKGVMNGITALMLATGNDTRAIEAGAHAYASFSGTYQPLVTWKEENGMIVGETTIPLALGTVGGSMGVLPKVKLARRILNVGDAKELMKVAAALGIAQNFAALYALTTDGINKGHMRLHARNIALEANASLDEIDDVVNYMIENNSITLNTAKKYLKK